MVGSIEAETLERQVVVQPIVEDAGADAEDTFGGFRAAGVDAPSQADTRRKVVVVGDVGLVFPTDTGAEGEIRADAPIVSEEQADVGLVNRRQSVATVDRELSSAAAQRSNLGGVETLLLVEQRPAVTFEGRDLKAVDDAATEGKCAAEVVGRDIGVGAGPDATAELDAVAALNNSRKILDFGSLGDLTGLADLDAATAEGVEDFERG